MKIKITKDAIWFLDLILRNPQQLPTSQAGMTQPGSPVPKYFISPDARHAKKVATLRKWLEDKVMQAVKDEDKDGKKKTVEYKFPEEGHDGSLQESYCEIIREILEFYRPVGGLVQMTNVYSELVDVFSGRVHKLDSLDSITMPDDDEKESKITSIDEGKKKDSKEA